MLFLLFLVIAPAYTEETYENSTNLCQRCSCTNNELIFNIRCTNQSFQHMLSTWPATNSSIIKAVFLGHNIEKLETIPPTDAILDIALIRCNIKDLEGGLFAGAKNIRMADFSYNHLTNEVLVAQVFSGPFKDEQMESIALEDLNLSYNNFHSLDSKLFKFLPNLKRLSLEGNKFKVLDIPTQKALSSVPNLLELSLANNDLVDLVANAIENYETLTKLDLSHNQFDMVPQSLKVIGKTLEVLILDDNPLIEMDDESFAGLNKLKEISANELPLLKLIKNNTFESMYDLRTIRIENNGALTEIESEAFSDITEVQELYLRNNNIKNLNYNLVMWRNLHSLEIQDNPLDCNCDLYKIAMELKNDIKRDENTTPHCLDPRNFQHPSVYSLKSDICEAKTRTISHQRQRLYQHISVPLAGLITTLICAVFVAITLAYSRYRTFLRNKNYPFAAQVLYNPIARSP